MLSFHQLLNDQPLRQSLATDEGCLFTRLKQNIIRKTNVPEIKQNNKDDIETLMKGHELQFQIYKLQKANYVVQRCMKNGMSIKQAMKQVIEVMTEQIKEILNKKPQQMVEIKGNSGMRSTVNCSVDQSVQTSRRQYKSPKMVQFTLGNKQLSSGQANHKQNKNPNEDVSQFVTSSKGMVSRGIKLKVMGGRKLK